MVWKIHLQILGGSHVVSLIVSVVEMIVGILSQLLILFWTGESANQATLP
jgi:hypothetical protein